MSLFFGVRHLRPTTIAHRLVGSSMSRAVVVSAHRRSLKTQPAYEGHIPLNWFETALMTVGSAYKALTDPRRGGACF